METYFIDPDIHKAHTLPGEFYRNSEVFGAIREKIFARTWQWIGHEELLPLEGHGLPFVYVDPFLPEPLLLIRDDQRVLHCLSNVCTHRGNILLHHPSKTRSIQCLYHGRKFKQDGSFHSMPEFDDVVDFPGPCDSLKSFSIERWGPFLFTSLSPTFLFSKIQAELDRRLGFLPLSEFSLKPEFSRDYIVHANWALYCDNYLEGFHIPFVHSDLNKLLDYSAYSSELFEYFNLQIGYAQGGTTSFSFPQHHPDFGKEVAAYYYWLFPNIMLNFYPWGLSVNIVKPIDVGKTRVSFLTYLLPNSHFDQFSESKIDKVEREDEFVVEGVFKGLQSRSYISGRFSPKRELGVHHFHRLLADFLAQ